MEPQWNPTVEAQAIGRAIRFGQTNQVTVLRYIMKDTVEEVRNRTTLLAFAGDCVYVLTVQSMSKVGNVTNCSLPSWV